MVCGWNRSGFLKRICVFVHAGLKEEARWYLSKFSWGHSFITLNEALLDKYAACKDGAAVLEAQNEYIKQAEDERAERRAKGSEYMTYSSSTSSEDDEDEEDDEAVGKSKANNDGAGASNETKTLEDGEAKEKVDAAGKKDAE